MKNLRLSFKMIGGFGLVALITLIVGFVGWKSTSRSSGYLYDMGTIQLPTVKNIMEIRSCMESLQTAQRTLLNPILSREERLLQYANIQEAGENYRKAKEAYGALPKGADEARLLEQFGLAVEDWEKENQAFLVLSRELDDLDILNPMALVKDLEKFRGDIYKLFDSTTKLVHFGTHFEGGDDPRQCDLGTWLSGVQTTNGPIQGVLEKFVQHHDEFHEIIKTIKELRKADNVTAAVLALDVDMVPPVNMSLSDLQALKDEAARADAIYQQMNRKVMVESIEKQKTAMEMLDKMITIQDAQVERDIDTALREAARAKVISAGGMFAGFIVALGLGLLSSLSIIRPLKRVIAGLSGEAARLASSAQQISSTSHFLSEGSSEQAASLEETSSSLEQMASMTRQNARNADDAKKMTLQATRTVEKVGQHMEDMSKAIDGITRSSEETGKIIKTIDEIAFQTNLLALNAAVEAARAGTAGAGFAVVADEVRSLAIRTTEAAKNTAELIEGTIRSIREGNQLTRATREAFLETGEISRKMAHLVEGIATASTEQAQGIDQINKAVADMDHVTQQNAANAEESAAASEELRGQSEQMKGFVVALLDLVYGNGNGEGAVGGKTEKITESA